MGFAVHSKIGVPSIMISGKNFCVINTPTQRDSALRFAAWYSIHCIQICLGGATYVISFTANSVVVSGNGALDVVSNTAPLEWIELGLRMVASDFIHFVIYLNAHVLGKVWTNLSSFANALACEVHDDVRFLRYEVCIAR